MCQNALACVCRYMKAEGMDKDIDMLAHTSGRSGCAVAVYLLKIRYSLICFFFFDTLYMAENQMPLRGVFERLNAVIGRKNEKRFYIN